MTQPGWGEVGCRPFGAIVKAILALPSSGQVRSGQSSSVMGQAIIGHSSFGLVGRDQLIGVNWQGSLGRDTK